MSPPRCFPWLLIYLCAAAVCAGTTWRSHAYLLRDTNNLHAFKFLSRFSTSFCIANANLSIISSTDHPHLYLLYRCGWGKSWQCVRNLSLSMWWPAGFAYWDPWPASCDQQLTWRPGKSSKIHKYMYLSHASWNVFNVFNFLITFSSIMKKKRIISDMYLFLYKKKIHVKVHLKDVVYCELITIK